jgi:hypothetical protein
VIECITADGVNYRNPGVSDIALCELLRGGIDPRCPGHIIKRLLASGYIKFNGDGDPVLTSAGHKRAKAIGPFEQQLRAQFSPALAGSPGRCMIKAIPTHAFRT